MYCSFGLAWLDPNQYGRSASALNLVPESERYLLLYKIMDGISDLVDHLRWDWADELDGQQGCNWDGTLGLE